MFLALCFSRCLSDVYRTCVFFISFFFQSKTRCIITLHHGSYLVIIIALRIIFSHKSIEIALVNSLYSLPYSFSQLQSGVNLFAFNIIHLNFSLSSCAT